jgi:hypothetical protein
LLLCQAVQHAEAQHQIHGMNARATGDRNRSMWHRPSACAPQQLPGAQAFFHTF